MRNDAQTSLLLLATGSRLPDGFNGADMMIWCRRGLSTGRYFSLGGQTPNPSVGRAAAHWGSRSHPGRYQNTRTESPQFLLDIVLRLTKRIDRKHNLTR